MKYKGKEVGLIYYRSGYTEAHFPGEQEWIIREKMELCRAVKVPNIIFHLLTLKIFQA